MHRKRLIDMKNIIRFCFLLVSFYGSQSFGQTFIGTGGALAPPGTTIGVVWFPVAVLGVPGSTITGVGSDISVPAILGYNTAITNISFQSIQHTWAADLDFRLISPAGTIYTFNTDNGGSSGLDVATPISFDVTAANCADSWTSSTSVAQPENGLRFETSENTCGPIDAAFSFACGVNSAEIVGDLINGLWVLEITDDSGGDTGSFTTFSLSFSSIAPPVMDSNGLPIDPTACAPAINILPYTQDFDAMNLCSTSLGAACVLTPTDGWFNSNVDDDIDWTVDVSGTSSSATGPVVDHSTGDETGKYLYIESSGSSGYPDKTAHLESPFFNFTGTSSPVLTFWYHMYGSTQGTMHFDVDPLGDGNWVNNVIPAWTDNQDIWQQKKIDLSAWEGNNLIKFRIRGITGSSFYSDMAVDDFLIEDNSFCVPIKSSIGTVAIVCL